VQNKGIPSDILTLKLEGPVNILDLLTRLGFCASKGEAKRLVAQGAVKFENEKIAEITATIGSEGIIQSGKRNYAKIVF
jgi:tyrosyl-tRNA synthetase